MKPSWGREAGTEPEHQSIFLHFQDAKECQQCLAYLHGKYIEGMTSNKRALGLWDEGTFHSLQRLSPPQRAVGYCVARSEGQRILDSLAQKTHLHGRRGRRG